MLVSCGNRLKEKVINTYDNGQASLVRYYDHDDQCVREVEYYEDGVLKMEGEMQDGHREGEWKAYFPDGRPQSIGFFKDGLRTGKATIYYSNGNLWMEGFYKEGKKVGEWTYYDEQGYKLRTDDYGE